MTLRPYQSRALGDVRRAFAGGARAVCLVLPTGAGKTHVAGAMSELATARGRRVLWLTHRVELVAQSSARVPWADVRSVQGLLASGERPDAGLLILDEAHHFGEGAERWSALARHYAETPTVGLTATPERGDGTGLVRTFDALVVGASYSELIRDGYLVPAEVWAGTEGADGIVEPYGPWSEHAAGRRTVVFARSVAHAAELAERWRSQGWRAAHVVGEQDAAERLDAVERFRAGDLDVLVNVHVLTEGFDVPGVECVVLARGFTSQGSYLQAVGRALRPAAGKTAATVLDCAGAVFAHGMPHADRSYSLEGRAVRVASEDVDYVPRMCRVCGWVLTGPSETCPRCGATVKRPLSAAQKRERVEAMQRVLEAHPAEKRAEKYRALCRVAEERGYRPGWAKVQFKVRYGAWPRREWV